MNDVEMDWLDQHSGAVDTAEAAPKPPCAFRLFGMMPPCVLPAGHEGDHQDGFGGYYGNGVTR